MPIGSASISNYYGSSIVAGDDSFYLPAYQFADIEQSLVKKLSAEVTGTIPEGASIPTSSAPPPADVAPAVVPVPAAAWMFITALAGMMVVGRKRSLIIEVK